jgi:four helix bundle protein
MRRASVSIPSNISEGSKRSSKKDFCQFLRITQGSGAELETQLLLTKDWNYISNKEYNEATILLEAIMRMLTGLINKLLTSDK